MQQRFEGSLYEVTRMRECRLALTDSMANPTPRSEATAWSELATFGVDSRQNFSRPTTVDHTTRRLHRQWLAALMPTAHVLEKMELHEKQSIG